MSPTHKEQTPGKVIVAGGGAAGLMAAGQAALAGAETLVIEKMKHPGRKLGITGKGRCNITNIADTAELISHFGKNGRFLRQAFTRFSNTDLISFFEELGLKLVKERGGRVFPACGRAPEVVAVLQQWLKAGRVQIQRSSPVDKLLITDGRITGVVSKGKKTACDALILATGGASYPATGSTGDGYKMASKCGHTIVPIHPALVPLETAGIDTRKTAGLNLRNIRVSMYIGNKKRHETFGEMVFTDFGVTGPVILTLSDAAVTALQDKRRVTLSFDLKPALDEKKLDARLQRDLASRGKERFDSILRGLLPRELIPACLRHLDVPPEYQGCRINAGERKRLLNWLKDFRLEVTGHRPFSEAIITAGGVDTSEIDPRTMESRKVRGLYLAGELLNIHADTGGYNLQAAFSTGWIAGRSAAEGLQSRA